MPQSTCAEVDKPSISFLWDGRLQFAAVATLIACTYPTVSFSASFEQLDSKSAISANVSSFAFRDQARWGDLRNLFTKDATLHISWYDGNVDGFIERSRRMVDAGAPPTKHLFSTPRVTVCGNRALSESDVTIMVRSNVGPVHLDVTSYTRFFDQLQLEGDGVWRVHKRTGIYEKDRIDSVGPSFLFWAAYLFMPLSKYPKEFRHLAFGLERVGLSAVPGVATSGSDAEISLKRSAWEWSGCSKVNGARLP